MKKIIIPLLLLCFTSKAQYVLSERLQLEINKSKKINHSFPIRIEMIDKIDALELHQNFKANEIPIKDRARITVQKLQSKAKETQKSLIEFINLHNPKSNVRGYWIINQIYLTANRELIYEIGKRADVGFVDLNIDKISPLEYIENENLHRSNGQIENGLEAINVPALWELGYSGKGLLVYNYDTGVCPEHPAIKDRFLANRFPMEQSWYGNFRSFPNEINSNHGTHTLGTIIGKGLSSGDTIGIAYGAYWMACDLVMSTVEELPPLEDIVAGYQWALDSDNNPETTDDIPDVINNSWRWNDNPDTVHCNDYIKDLMNALEAVGIANVFSGGNAGPNNITISAPQRINTTIVNTFSVGSIDANNFELPISYFSSRGPLQCLADDSSRIIHPEVVAPGHNVRSSVGVNSYSTKSGTSMAAPHVSGAVLLLKEAFPELSGADILTALYYTASDLGVPGEDNTFGMGIIDCFAAYEYLSQHYTPINPYEPSNDLQLIKINEPSALIHCSNTVYPNVSIKNNGVASIDSIIFSVYLNGNQIENTTWYGTINYGDTVDVELNNFTISENDSIENELQIIAQVPNWIEKDQYNNSLIQRFKKLPTINTPFIEGFESNSFENNEWRIINSDGEETWQLDQTYGLENSSFSAKIAFFTYDNLNQKDQLLTPNIQVSSLDDYYLSFDYSHQHRNSIGREDSLIIEISPDCGKNYYQILSKSGSTLSTSDTLDMNFNPIYSSHWAHESIPLNDYLTESNTIQIKFTGINGKQNNLFLDNITIASLDEFSNYEFIPEDIILIPNPASTNIHILWNGKGEEKVNISLIDQSGRKIENKVVNCNTKTSINWNIAKLESGYYLFHIKTQDKILIKSFVKN